MQTICDYAHDTRHAFDLRFIIRVPIMMKFISITFTPQFMKFNLYAIKTICPDEYKHQPSISDF